MTYLPGASCSQPKWLQYFYTVRERVCERRWWILTWCCLTCVPLTHPSFVQTRHRVARWEVQPSGIFGQRSPRGVMSGSRGACSLLSAMVNVWLFTANIRQICWTLLWSYHGYHSGIWAYIRRHAKAGLPRSGADPGFVERGGGGVAQRRSRLKTLFGISKGGAQGACALFGPPWRPSLEFQRGGGARPLRPPWIR